MCSTNPRVSVTASETTIRVVLKTHFFSSGSEAGHRVGVDYCGQRRYLVLRQKADMMVRTCFVVVYSPRSLRCTYVIIILSVTSFPRLMSRIRHRRNDCMHFLSGSSHLGNGAGCESRELRPEVSHQTLLPKPAHGIPLPGQRYLSRMAAASELPLHRGDITTSGQRV